MLYVLSAIIPYLIVSFVCWEFNPEYWPTFWRLIGIVLIVIAMLGVYGRKQQR